MENGIAIPCAPSIRRESGHRRGVATPCRTTGGAQRRRRGRERVHIEGSAGRAALTRREGGDDGADGSAQGGHLFSMACVLGHSLAAARGGGTFIDAGARGSSVRTPLVVRAVEAADVRYGVHTAGVAEAARTRRGACSLQARIRARIVLIHAHV